MPFYSASTAGSRVTKSGLSATTATDNDPKMVVPSDVWEETQLNGSASSKGRRKKWYAGQVVRQSEIDKAYTVTVGTVTPATGGTAGGTVVTLVGRNLSQATGVTFGGTAGTSFTVVDDETVRVTTPAKTAGAQAILVQNDSGVAVSGGNFTYA